MTNTVALSILAGVGAALIAVTVWLILRMRISPRERERRRRVAVNAHGRMTDGSVTEATAGNLFYTYSVAGVEYTTSQDVSDLTDMLPLGPEHYIGCTVTVKYSTKNPANSIVVCEEWTGLRTHSLPLRLNRD